jgi:tetratricopeptide (TPR) repeat protein
MLAPDLDSAAASMETLTGQKQLETKKAGYALHDKQDDAAMSDALGAVRDDFIMNKVPELVQTAKSTGLIKKIGELLGLANPPSETYMQTDRAAALQQQKADMHLLQLNKQLKKIQTHSTPDAARTAAIQQARETVVQIIKDNKEVRQSSTANTLAYADKLLAKMMKNTSTQETASAAPAEDESVKDPKEPTIEDMRKALKQEKDKLLAAQGRMKDAIEALKKAKDAIKGAEQGALIAQIDELEKEKGKLDKILELESKVEEMDTLIAGQSDDKVKAMLIARKVPMIGQLEALSNGIEHLEVADLDLVAANVRLKEVKREEVSQQQALVAAKDEIQRIRGSIGALISAIAQMDKKAKQERAEEYHVDETTSMVLEKDGQKIAFPVQDKDNKNK